MITPKKGLWPWVFQRVTAIFLVVGLLAHFWAVHYGLKDPLLIGRVRNRIHSNWWQLLDILLLLAALYHGINGIWGIFLDYCPKEKTKKITGVVLVFLAIITSIVGIVIFIPLVRGPY